MAIRSPSAPAVIIAVIGFLAASSSGVAGNEGGSGSAAQHHPIVVAQNNTLGSNQQPEPCDCTNCSAEHCPGPNGGHYPNPWVPPGNVPFQPDLKSSLPPLMAPKLQIQKAN